MYGREGGRSKGQSFVQGLNLEERCSRSMEVNYPILIISLLNTTEQNRSMIIFIFITLTLIVCEENGTVGIEVDRTIKILLK